MFQIIHICNLTYSCAIITSVGRSVSVAIRPLFRFWCYFVREVATQTASLGVLRGPARTNASAWALGLSGFAQTSVRRSQFHGLRYYGRRRCRPGANRSLRRSKWAPTGESDIDFDLRCRKLEYWAPPPIAIGKSACESKQASRLYWSVLTCMCVGCCFKDLFGSLLSGWLSNPPTFVASFVEASGYLLCRNLVSFLIKSFSLLSINGYSWYSLFLGEFWMIHGIIRIWKKMIERSYLCCFLFCPS